MAITISNNLYPPIFVQSYAPAFIYNQTCKLYFSLSVYNTESEIHADRPVQISIRHQKTNESVLDTTKYPSNIMLTDLKKDTERTGNDKYYIQIKPTDLKNGFTLNEYYKVQIRLTAADAASPPRTGQGMDAWLSQNITYFSEWSTVVLIYGISKPILTLSNFNKNEITTFTIPDITVLGRFSFKNNLDKQTIIGYRIKLLDKESNELLEDSNNIFINNYQAINEINYDLKTNFIFNKNYLLKIQILTKNLYSWEEWQNYEFLVSEQQQAEWDADFDFQAEEDSGSLKVYIKTKYGSSNQKRYFISNESTLMGKSLYVVLTQDIGSFSSVTYIPDDQDEDDTDDDDTLFLYNESDINHDLSKGTKIVFKRASSRNNFSQWQEIDVVTIDEDNVVDLTWFDYTIEPGVWYKYYLIRYNSSGGRTSYKKNEEPVMVVPEDIFLEADGKQLRVRFDPQIDNFNIVVSESLTQTIGSQYPFVTRNGNIYYKTFSLSGTITGFMDIKDNLFKASKKDLYGESEQFYNNYNQQHRIDEYNDYIYEREFRNAVIDFLYKNNVKLFRSLTEGNILVKLMDISLTPNATLSRRIYSFSCTAYEIGECNLNNFKEYGILQGRHIYTIE